KVLIQDCYFKGNKALKIESNEVARGGAIYVYPSPTLYPNPLELTIERCTFDSNISEYDGSALYIMMGTSEEVNKVIVQNCTFVNNVNKNGGVHPTHKTANLAAIFVRGYGDGANNGEIKFINNTIAYNSNERSGGHPGFHNGGYPNLTMINNLFFENTHAGGKYSFRSTADMVESRNNIADVVFSAADGLNRATAFSNNIEDATSEQLKLDEAIADNGGETPTLALNAGSIAINAGYATGIPMLDQRGFPREGTPDVGAFEAGFSAVKNITYTQNLSSMLTVDRNGIVSKVFGNMRVFTVDGKCIREGKVKEGQFIPLSAGMYVIHIDNANLQKTGKVVL
ncbi:MAG: choice-of-anchor Q domain-containing protein, partial [Ignavibacteriaceae bacterium]|nr:choice-of-anchor Q domain-containing protein [Ignavibacteriaceae bacterium]